MKKHLLIISICLLLFIDVHAKKVKGKIYFRNDTVNVTFDIHIKFLTGDIDYPALQRKVKYYDSKGKSHVLKPNQAIEIRFEIDANPIRMVSIPSAGFLGFVLSLNSDMFLKLEIDGKLRMFSYYFYTSGGLQDIKTGSMITYQANLSCLILLQKENGQIKWPQKKYFKKNMMEYLSDCPDLVTEIDNNEYNVENIYDLATSYNSKCSK